MWISLPLSTMYIISFVGNLGLVYLIYCEASLHPQCIVFWPCCLLLLYYGTTTLPYVLCIFWLNFKKIKFNACLAQMFFVYGFTGVESGMLMLMALERYVAICYPLHYATILINLIIAKGGLATFLSCVLLMIPFPF